MTLAANECFDQPSGRLPPDATAGLEGTLQWQLADLEPAVRATGIKADRASLLTGSVAETAATFPATRETWLAFAEGRQDATPMTQGRKPSRSTCLVFRR